MKQHRIFLLTAVCAAILILAVGTLVLAQSPSDSQPNGSNQGIGSQGTDSNPTGIAEVFIPQQYQPSAMDLARAQAISTVTVYFTPQDEDTSTTVLFLYNTNPLTATVGLQTFKLDGTLEISTTVAVPPNGLVRICADTVSTISATWQNVVFVNLRTYSTYAKMTLPAKVKAEAYVVWDTSGTYDPLTSLQTLPIRFSTDPPTILLPLVNK